MKKYFKNTMRNKMFGILFIALAIIVPLVDETGDCTVSIFLFMIGIPALFTKESLFYTREQLYGKEE